MSAAVNRNFAELYRVQFGATPPQATDPHILWADTTASPATLKTYSGGTWVPVAGGDGGGGGGGVAQVAVTPPATNTGTPTAPIIGVAPATAQAAGSLAAADYGKLQAVEAGAQANVLEAVSGTAPITVGAVANKAQAIGIAPASQAAPGSLSAADKAKLDGVTAGAQANVLEDVTVASTTTALTVTNGAAGGIVAKVKAVSLAVANAVAGGAAGLLTGADKSKLDGVATGAQANLLESVTGTAPLLAGAVTAKSQALSIVPATASVPGSMSAADKARLDGLATIASVATPLTLAGGVLDIQAASASQEGSLAAARYAAIQYIRTIGTAPADSLSYDAPNGYAFLAGQLGAYQGANAWFDGANWQRFDTAKAAAVIVVNAPAGTLALWTAGAGANPIAWAAQAGVTPAQLANVAQLVAATAWAAVAFGAGWGNLGGGYAQGTYRREGLGTVALAGMVTKATTGAVNDTVATVPAGFRPQVLHYFTCACQAGATTLYVDSGGNVKLGAALAAGWVSLDGVRYDPAT